MPATLFNSGLLIKPATKISELSIDTDKSWALYPASAHSTAWAAGLSAFTQRRRFSLYGTTREDWYDVNWLYRKQFSVRQVNTDVCTGGTASASSEFSAVESAAKAFDNDFTTSKWVTAVSYPPCWIKYDRGAGNEIIVTSYTITSGNDAPNRDPMNWTFEGSNDDINWTVLDTQIGQSFSARLQTKAYGPFTNITAYRYYRLNISANHGANMTQIEELEFCQNTPALDDYQVRLRLTRSSGTDVAGQIFVDTDVLATFADIRFTSEDGTTLIPHWIETISGSDCYVWVKLPYLPCRVYLYYGNAAAPSASDGTATWIIFNDGSTLVGWTLFSPVPAGGACSVAIVAGKIRFTSLGVGASAHLLCDTVTGINSYRLGALVTAQDGLTAGNYQQGLVHKTSQNDLDNAEARWLDNTNKWLVADEAGGSTWSALDNAFDARNEHKYMLTRLGDDSKLYVDDLLKATHVRAAWLPQVIGLHNYLDAIGHWNDYRNIFVGKYTSPEPVFGISDQREIQTLPTTLYPMMLTVHYGSGTDSPTDVYLNSLCYPDFRDIRFTNNAGTKLHYFIDNYVESSYATVWILFDTVPGAGATLNFWLYYGDSAAITESSLLNTFPLFSDGPYSGVLDAAKWLALSGTWDVSAITNHWNVAVNAIRQSNVAGADYAMRTVADILGDNMAIDCWSRGTNVATAHGVSLRCIDNNNYYSGHHGGFGSQRSLWKRVASVNTGLAALVGARDLLWHTHSLRVNGTRLTYIQDGTEDALVASDAALTAANLKLALSAYGAAGAASYMTDVRIRPFYYQEPIFGAWAVAETYATFYGISNLKELAAGMIKGDMLVSDGTNIIVVTPGSVGSNLIAKDPGNLPVWEYPP